MTRSTRNQSVTSVKNTAEATLRLRILNAINTSAVEICAEMLFIKLRPELSANLRKRCDYIVADLNCFDIYILDSFVVHLMFPLITYPLYK